MSTVAASRLFKEPMTLVAVTQTPGPDGRPVSSATSTEVLGAFRHRVTFDGFNAGTVATDETVVYLPPGTAVSVGDQIVVRGEQYEITSTGFPQVNFRTGDAHHLEVRARRSTR